MNYEDPYFDKKIERGTCWQWLGAKAKNTRTGQLHGTYAYKHNGEKVGVCAHRYTWHLYHESLGLPALAQNEDLWNTCGNYLCVNPTHHEPRVVSDVNPPFRPRDLEPVIAVGSTSRRRTVFTKPTLPDWWRDCHRGVVNPQAART